MSRWNNQRFFIPEIVKVAIGRWALGPWRINGDRRTARELPPGNALIARYAFLMAVAISLFAPLALYFGSDTLSPTDRVMTWILSAAFLIWFTGWVYFHTCLLALGAFARLSLTALLMAVIAAPLWSAPITFGISIYAGVISTVMGVTFVSAPLIAWMVSRPSEQTPTAEPLKPPPAQA